VNRYAWAVTVAMASSVLLVWGLSARTSVAAADTFEVNDVHLQLTNYVQQGTNIHDFMKIMGTKVGRTAIFGIPLQQQWSYGNTGEFAPTYYLQTDAPLYYYSFTDAAIAMAYRSLTPAEQARLDPMITDETAKYIVSSPDTIAAGRPDQPPSGSVPVRHRRSGALGSGRIPEGVSPVPAAVRAADALGQRAGAEEQLSASLRRGATQGQGLGAGQLKAAAFREGYRRLR
jgi:hypothetical protein